jgi:hypothetical protein
MKSEAFKLLKHMALESGRAKHPGYPAHLTFPVKSYSDKTANGLTRCIIDFLKLSGWQAERINTMGRPIDNRQIVTDVLGNRRQIGSIQWISSGVTPGSADISATIAGRSVKIEVKCKATGDHYQSEGQKLYQKQIEAAGGLYCIARDFQSFYQWYLLTFSDKEVI